MNIDRLGLESGDHFRLATYAKIYAFAITLVFLVVRAVQVKMDSYAMGESVARVLPGLIISLLAAWMTWHGRGKTYGAGNRVFCLVFTFMLISKLGADAQQRRLSQSAREIEISTKIFQEEVTDATTLQDMERAAGKYRSSIKASLYPLALSGDKSDHEAVEMIADYIFGKQAESLRWYRACDAANSSEMMSLVSLTDHAEYENRTAVLQAYADESKNSMSSLTLGIEPLKAKLGPLADRRSVKLFIKGLETSSTAERPMVEALLQAHLSNADAMLGLLDFLRTHKAKWRMEGDELLFSEESLVAQYAALVARMEKSRAVIEKLSTQANAGNK